MRSGNETRAPIANPPNNAQQGGTHYHSPKLYPGPYSSVHGHAARARHTDARDQNISRRLRDYDSREM